MEPTVLVNLGGEMPKVDDRFVTKPYNTVFLSAPAPKKGEGVAPLGLFYNTFAKCNVKTGKIEFWCAGENTEVQEVAFVARSPDGELLRSILLEYSSVSPQLTAISSSTGS